MCKKIRPDFYLKQEEFSQKHLSQPVEMFSTFQLQQIFARLSKHRKEDQVIRMERMYEEAKLRNT